MTTLSSCKGLILLLVIVVCSINGLYAQDATMAVTSKQKKNKLFGNSIQLVTGNYYVKDKPHTLPKSPFAQIGIYATCRIYKNIGVGLGYSQWNRSKLFVINKHHGLQETSSTNYIPIVGQLESRYDFKMADGYINYQHNLFNSAHYVYAQLGLSYCWGINEYLDLYWRNPEPGGDVIAFYRQESASYWGIIPGIGYNYYFLKNRLNVGMLIRGRYYRYRTPMQLDMALNIGVNF